MTVPKKEQNAGVELLLKRMETHPEEFTGENAEGSKWSRLISNYEQHLTKEDRDALNEGIDKILQQRFTEKVLEGLVDPKPSTKLEELLSLKRQNATLSAGATPVRSSVTLNNTNAVSGTWGASSIQQATQLQHMLDHRKYLERLAEDAGIKEHKTLFGKLKNYLHAE